MKRRQLLAGGTVGLLSTAGCVGLIRAQLSGDSDGAEASNETNDTDEAIVARQGKGWVQGRIQMLEE